MRASASMVTRPECHVQGVWLYELGVLLIHYIRSWGCHAVPLVEGWLGGKNSDTTRGCATPSAV